MQNRIKFLSFAIVLSTLVFILSSNRNTDHSIPGETETLSIWHDGIEREFIIHTPNTTGPSSPSPLVLNFHGYGSSADQHMKYSKFNNIADTAHFIVVYPQGTKLKDKTHWNVGGWTLESTTDDVAFVSALIDTLSVRYQIATDRIYATGMSNGGYMSFLLACELSDKIAAIASVTGSMTIQTFRDCAPDRVVPVLQMHGTADQTVPYLGAPTWTLGIDKVINYWTEFNQTDSAPIVTPMADIDPADGSTVERYVYSSSTKEIAVVHYKVNGGGHEWFGAWGNKDIDASQIIWSFFSEYDINGRIAVK